VAVASTRWLRRATRPLTRLLTAIALLPMRLPGMRNVTRDSNPRTQRILDLAWYLILAVAVCVSAAMIVEFLRTSVDIAEVLRVAQLTFYTFLRVSALIALTTLVWVPIGVWIGLRPRIAEKVQPLAQFLAAFPANVLFPVAVIGILRFHLDPNIWLSVLIVFGTQWYIAFNVIAGANAFPNDLREASQNFRVHGFNWWKSVILPAIFPYYVTGAITASGGSWNASIVAEYVKWGDDRVTAQGVGAYIAQATEVGDYPKIVLGVAAMSIVVILVNRLFWRRLSVFAESRLRLL
jgi:NitT/TauT family transport system permease protein